MTRFVLALTLVAACGPLPQQNTKTASAKPGQKVKCQQVQTTGSMMSRTMCRSDDDSESQRAAAQGLVGGPKGATELPKGAR